MLFGGAGTAIGGGWRPLLKIKFIQGKNPETGKIQGKYREFFFLNSCSNPENDLTAVGNLHDLQEFFQT